VELNLGVIDAPHLDSRITTGDLAQILESKYDLFRGFYESNADQIADILARSIDSAMSDLLNTGHAPENPYADGCEEIAALFKSFLDTGAAEKIGMIGVPTQAALKGINHRKSAFQKGARRPSFEDTMMLRNSLLAWMEK